MGKGGISSIVRSEVYMAVTIKNSVFWDIKTQLYLRGNILRLRYRAQPINVM
jgi:hypothetical protein